MFTDKFSPKIMNLPAQFAAIGTGNEVDGNDDSINNVNLEGSEDYERHEDQDPQELDESPVSEVSEIRQNYPSGKKMRQQQKEESATATPIPLESRGRKRNNQEISSTTTKHQKQATKQNADMQGETSDSYQEENSEVQHDLQDSFKFDGNDKQQRQDMYGFDRETSYYNLGWEFKRRRLLTIKRKKDLLPATPRPVSSNNLQTIDFDQLAASSEWAKLALFETLSTTQIDELVGLATTLREDNANINAAFETSQDNYDGHGQDNENSASGLPSFRDVQQQNLLASLSSSPPLPPSFLRYIQFKASEQLTKDEHKKAAESRLDDSAAVAIGMALEDSITASLLPLAGLHVLRCRALEDMAVTEETTSYPMDYSKWQSAFHPITGRLVQLNMERILWKTEKASDEWTLPPDEAIMKLLEQGMISKNTTYFLANASRKINIGSEDPRTDSSASLSDVSYTEDIHMWSKLLNVSPSVIHANPDLIGVFMTHPTTASQQG
jgi:hypothetical protein